MKNQKKMARVVMTATAVTKMMIAAMRKRVMMGTGMKVKIMRKLISAQTLKPRFLKA
jgi:hypothetical protein